MRVFLREYGMTLFSVIVATMILGFVYYTGGKVGDNALNVVQLQNIEGQNKVKQINPKEDTLTDYDIFKAIKTWTVVEDSNIKYAKYSGTLNVSMWVENKKLCVQTAEKISKVSFDEQNIELTDDTNFELDKDFSANSVYHKITISTDNEDTIYYVTDFDNSKNLK